jgi:CHRD domain
MRRHHKSALVVVCTGVLVGAFGLGGMSVASGDDGDDGNNDETELSAQLSGDQGVPPADPDGTGDAKVEFTPAEGELCFEVKFDNTGTPNRGHIHRGQAGVNGPIVVEFFELAMDPADPRHDQLEAESGLEDCVQASEAILNEIAGNPQGFYVNIHNARFPAGAIRGQLEG